MPTTNFLNILFVLALLLFTSTASPELVIDGQLCCTITGNCYNNGVLPTIGVKGVNILLYCNDTLDTRVVVGQSLTQRDGYFEIKVSEAIKAVASCSVVVQLPVIVTGCPRLSTATGCLVGNLGTTVERGAIEKSTVMAFVGISYSECMQITKM